MGDFAHDFIPCSQHVLIHTIYLTSSVLILGLRPANERRRYKVTLSLIGGGKPRIRPASFTYLLSEHLKGLSGPSQSHYSVVTWASLCLKSIGNSTVSSAPCSGQQQRKQMPCVNQTTSEVSTWMSNYILYKNMDVIHTLTNTWWIHKEAINLIPTTRSQGPAHGCYQCL